MMGVRGRFAVGLAALAVGFSLAGANPHVVERWALYLGSPQPPGSAQLFLDPFPDSYSCESRVRVFTANAEHAFCRSRYEFELGNAADAVLAADFNPLSPAAWFCAPRWGRRSSEVASIGSGRTSASRR